MIEALKTSVGNQADTFLKGDAFASKVTFFVRKATLLTRKVTLSRPGQRHSVSCVNTPGSGR
jgi:hypothetical protein